MNANMKQQVIDKVKTFLLSEGYTADRWGHYTKLIEANPLYGSKQHYARYRFSSNKLHLDTKLHGYNWCPRKDAYYRNVDVGPTEWKDGKQCVRFDRQCTQDFVVNDLVLLPPFDDGSTKPEQGRVFDTDHKSNCLYVQVTKVGEMDDGIREVPLGIGGPRITIVREQAMCADCHREFPINRDGRMSSHALPGKEFQGATGLCPGTGKMMRNQ